MKSKKIGDYDGEIVMPRHSRISKRRRFQQQSNKIKNRFSTSREPPNEISSDVNPDTPKMTMKSESRGFTRSVSIKNHQNAIINSWKSGPGNPPVQQQQPKTDGPRKMNLTKQRSSSGPDSSSITRSRQQANLKQLSSMGRSRSGPESSFERIDLENVSKKMNYLTTTTNTDSRIREQGDNKSSFGDNSQTDFSPIHSNRPKDFSAFQIQSTKALTAVLAAASVAGAEPMQEPTSDEEDNEGGRGLARYLKLRNTRSSVDDHSFNFLNILSNKKKKDLKRSRTSLRRRNNININKECLPEKPMLEDISKSIQDLNKNEQILSNIWTSHCQITRRTSVVPSRWSRKQSENRSSSDNEDTDEVKISSPEWLSTVKIGEHYWSPIQSSGYNCFLDDSECIPGAKRKCSACHIVVHEGCVERLQKINFMCKPTFREDSSSTNNSILNNIVRHHWVHSKRQDGKCKQCGKSFQMKLPFNKEVLAITCSWCKDTYHNRMQCFMIHLMTEPCTLGSMASVIVPPTWIYRINQRISTTLDSEKNVSRLSEPLHRMHSRRLVKSKIPFVIKCPNQTTHRQSNTPIPHPLLILVNCRSGGNQGAKLLQKFQWLLNPRQVFDISVSGPKLALELYKSVANLRILVCGGDGTMGWILTTIESTGIKPFPPCAILPLGTGNDLARTLNWGPGYVDESVKKIIQYVDEGSVVQLDRWNVSVEANSNCLSSLEDEEYNTQENNNYGESGQALNCSKKPASQQQAQLNNATTNSEADDTGGITTNTNESRDLGDVEGLEDEMMINVFNNYFSLGADAAAALEFHESREANPEKFNSRLKNKMFYFGVGGKDLLKRSWRDLTDHITLQCDRLDLTPRIRALKLHCLLFLNIPRYSAGTMPWGNPTYNMGFEPQRIDDGYLEVIGFTSTSLATLQVGGHGLRICQCRTAILTTSKTVPMQVDGEPCRLKPSIIRIWRRSQASLIRKTKRKSSINMSFDDGNFAAPLLPRESSISERIRMEISVISYTDYEDVGYDRELVQQTSFPLSMVSIENDATLDVLREYVLSAAQKTPIIVQGEKFYLSNNWFFLDSTTNERLFRIEKSQESFYYITDLNSEHVLILDQDWNNQSQESPNNTGIYSVGENYKNESYEDESILSNDSCKRRDTLVSSSIAKVLSEISEHKEFTEKDSFGEEQQSQIKGQDSLNELYVETEEKETQKPIKRTPIELKRTSTIQSSPGSERNNSLSTVEDQPEARSRSQSENPAQIIKNISKAPSGLRQRRQSLFPTNSGQKRIKSASIAHTQMNHIFNSPAIMAMVESATKAAVSATLKSFAMQSEESMVSFWLNEDSTLDEFGEGIGDETIQEQEERPEETEIDESPLETNVHPDQKLFRSESNRRSSFRRASYQPRNSEKMDQNINQRRSTLQQGPAIYVTPEEAAVVAVSNVIRRCSLMGGRNPNQLGFDAKQQKRRDSFLQAMNRSLHDACKRGQLDRVRGLIEDGADILSLDPNNGMTCLHQAARFGREEITRFLIQIEPELLSMRDAEKGQTALHKAAWCQRKKVCSILLSAGCSNLVLDNDGKRPDEEALRAGDLELAKFIQEFKFIDEMNDDIEADSNEN